MVAKLVVFLVLLTESGLGKVLDTYPDHRACRKGIEREIETLNQLGRYVCVTGFTASKAPVTNVKEPADGGSPYKKPKHSN